MKCTFCDRSVFGSRYRFYSVDYTFEMIKTLHTKYGIKDLLFEDDSFTLQKNRVVALCNKLLDNNLKISWSCLGRIDCIDADMLAMMKKAGCWQIGFGIESGNADILHSVEKKTSIGRIQEALTVTKKAGIHTKGFFIVGLPNETEKSVQETIRFAKAIDLDDISVSFCTPFPGTVLNQNIAGCGTFDPDWRKMNLMNAVFVPTGLTKAQLEKFHASFFRSFYLRPRIVRDYFFRSIVNVKIGIRLFRGMCTFFSFRIRKGQK